MSLLLLILCGIIGFTLLFIACELSHRMTCAFDEINLTIEKLNWYLFPIEVKRMLPMIIATAQEPVALECFGSISCTRDVLKNVGTKLSYQLIK